MDQAILLQKQVRDNSEDLQKEFREMKHWEEQMRKKDMEIRNANCDEDLPPIRTKKKKKISSSTEVTNDEEPTKAKRIAAYDYKAWDKFDVDKACSEVDENNENEKQKDKEAIKEKDSEQGKPKLVEEVISKEELKEKHEKANVLKEEGNALVQKREYAKGVGKYSEAIRIFPGDAVYYANRALCQLKIDNLYSAESDCSAAIKLNENYVKAYHRRATIRIEMKRYEDAKIDLESVLRLDPSNKEAKCMLMEITKKIEKSQPLILASDGKAKASPLEKKIAEKMFGGKEKKIHEISAGTSKSVKLDKKEEKTSFKQVIQHENKVIDSPKFKPTVDAEEDELPPWLPKLKDGLTIVDPLEEPPQKSSKTLTRVPVTELPENESIFKDIVKEIKRVEKSLIKDQAKSTKSINQVQQNRIESTSEIISKQESNELEIIPPPPKSSVAFLLVWRKDSSLDFKYKYLKQIAPKDIPDIFKESMESNIFSDILNVLNIKFVQNDETTYDYLHYLTQVKRFRALILFMSQADKDALKNLLEYCKTKEGKTDEEIRSLQTTYEM